MADELNTILAFWEESLPSSVDTFTAADDAVSACAADLRHFIKTGEVPSWIPQEARRG